MEVTEMLRAMGCGDLEDAAHKMELVLPLHQLLECETFVTMEGKLAQRNTNVASLCCRAYLCSSSLFSQIAICRKYNAVFQGAVKV